MSKSTNSLEQVIEALFFAYGEPLKVKKLAAVTQRSVNEVTAALHNLKGALSQRGLRLIDHNGEWQLVTAPELAGHIEKLVKSELREEITPASLEVLAIIAYRGGAVRAVIESIRGVNSSYALRNLMLRGLVEKETSDKHLTSYRPTLTALRKLGLQKIEDLPKFGEFQQELGRVEELLNDKFQNSNVKPNPND